MKKLKYYIKFAFIILLFWMFLPPKVHAENNDTYDIVIKNGNVYNPSTEHILEDYHIGISGSTIKAITQEEIIGETEIDASNLVVSPGFIDLVSYDPNSVGIELKVLDGVTSNLAMHGGTEDAETWYRNWGNNGVLTNFGASSFITRQRWPIVGADIDVEMTDQADIDQLVNNVRKNVEAGALGISFSLEYVPGVKHELIPLLELAHEYNLPTFYHLRYSDKDRGLQGIQEVIDAGNETGATIHIMHINSTGGTFVMKEALEMVEQARADGLDITTDFYPYDFWATYLGSARFRPGWQERFNITYEDLQIGGTDIRITEDTFDQYRSENPLVAALGSMPESELEMLLKHPDTMVGSDTIIEPHYNNHPRGAGAFSRLFGKYVREEQFLSIMDAVKKASYFPAKRMEISAPAMKNKGKIETGADADLTIFDPDTISDQSTVKDTALPSKGVEYVLINGVVTKNTEGLIPGVASGKPIKSYFIDEIPELNTVDYEILLDENIISIDNVYELENELYFSISKLADVLYTDLIDNKNGEIQLEDTATFQIGKKEAYALDKKIELSHVPIMYQEDIFVSQDSLQQLLSEAYDVSITDERIELTSLEIKPKNINNNKSTINKNYIIVIILVITTVIGFIILYRQKRNKK